MNCGEAATRLWSELRVRQLREHHAVGLTAVESAGLLGVSKNAVISKRYRLGLFSWRKPPAIEADEPAAPGRRRLRAVFVGPPILPCEPLPDMDRPVPVDARPASLTERRPYQCAWPLGSAEQPADYQTLFCCAPVQPGRSYCACHARWARRG